MEIITNQDRNSNNDPINFKQYNKELELISNKNKIIDYVNINGYYMTFSEVYCRCFKKTRILRENYFSNACSLYYYYLDVTTYFKKMMEIDIIKYFLFTKNERSLISIISNPDFTIDEEEMNQKLKSQYREFNKEYFEHKIEVILKDVLKEGRNRNGVNKLMQLIQNGNQVVFDY